MSVIIRLQNLPWSANALDIRQYFSGLSIPEGGVHIVGGELGDAFIAFSTDEDARQAFQRNHGKIKEVQINLLLSSRTEMQKVIEAARNMQTPFSAPIIQAAVTSPVALTISPQIEIKKDDDIKIKEETRSRSTSRERSDRKGRRRSRSRSRSRDRRDRSRERRRRRDRSRSRDRRDRPRRDRRDRSKSRERTRSRDRDSRDRKSRDRRRDSKSDEKVVDTNSNNSMELPEQKPLRRTHWDRTNASRIPLNHNSSNAGVGLLGKYPGQLNTPLDDTRRNMGPLQGLQNLQTQQPNLLNSSNDVNGSYPRNDPIKREWPNKPNRFPERLHMNQSLQNTLPNFAANSMRPLLSQDMGFGNNQRNMGLFSNNMNMRMPFNQDMGGNMNRPGFLNRANVMPDAMSNHSMQNDYRYDIKKEMPHESDSYRKDTRGRFESCVQLRPYYGGYGDIRRFFHGLHISNSGIKLATDNGKRNGTVYIRFVRPDARPLALSKSGQQLRGVVVDVNPLSEEEFDKCGIHDDESDDEKDNIKHEKDDNSSSNSSKPFNCIVVVDIPTFAKEQDILKMFSDYSLLGIHIYKENKRRNAYVQFNKEEDAERAFGEKDKHTLGGKPVIVRRCTENMMKQAGLEESLAEAEHAESDDVIEVKEDPIDCDPYSGNAASYDTDVVLLTGMPYKTTDRDVIDFFSDIGLIPIRIHMCQGKYGQSNECYCEFSSPDEAIAALDKNGMPLGNSMVNVEPFPRKDMEKRLLGLGDSHLQRFQGRLGPRPMMMGLPPRPLLPNMMRHPPMNRYDGPYDSNTMGPPGCVLGMENVPFKATIDEILDFFKNFDVTSHNVLRRYNDNGTCTGDARVTFNSPNECQKAYEQLKFKKIRDRTIYLRIL